MRLENNVGDKQGRVNEDYDRSNSFSNYRMKVALEIDNARTRQEVREENQRMKMSVKDVKGSVEGEKNTTEVGNSVKRKAAKEHKSYLGLDETKGTVVSRETTYPFETVARKQVKDAGILEPHAKSRGFRQNNMIVLETFEQKEDGKIVHTREGCGLEENNVREETCSKSSREQEHLKEATVAQKACKLRETEKSFLVSQQDGEIKTPSEADENELYENLIEIQLKDNDMVTGAKSIGANEKAVAESQLQNDNEMKGYYMGPDPYEWEDYDIRCQEAIEKEHEKGLNDTKEQDAKEVWQQSPPEIETTLGEEENDHEIGESKRTVEDPLEWEENKKRSVEVSEQEENKKKQTLDHSERILYEELIQEEDKKKAEKVLEQEEKVKEDNICARDENEQMLNHAGANDNIETNHEMGCNSEENRKLQKDLKREESKQREEVVPESDGIENEQEGTKWEDDNKGIDFNEENDSSTGEHSEASDGVYQEDDTDLSQASGDVEHDIPSERNEPTPEKNGRPRSHGYNETVGGTVEQMQELGEESVCLSALNQDDLQHEKAEVRMADVTNSNSLNGSARKTYDVNVIEQTQIQNDKTASESTYGLENANNHTHNLGGKRTNDQGAQPGVAPEGRNISTSPQVFREWVAGTKPQPDQVDSLRNTNNAAPKVAGRSLERSNKALSEDREKEEKLQRVRELENEHVRKIEEERERQIEREKDRMAVDRATLETRERVFAETRERAERAAVERATAEFRQRALAEARERLEKACAEARERSLAEKALEGRLRVEKATAEARERAERSVVDKFSASRSSGRRQNSSSSDLPDSQFQKVGSYSGLRYSQTAANSGGEGESPQRCKARLERHQRTADRAAKALAEKNMRDLIAQKEQAERNRLAEGLDAEVKRWSSGKQGNLRALLSTLQYILGSDSGWQPVPLTEVITTAAVKKAYRKATLCVHPDKLQQRGASIQQKYVCEKVFDLLKEAWNKFNSEER